MIYRAGGANLLIPGLQVIQARADTPWWMAAGVTPVAAYAPKGAADLASSYVNLANPGTNNAALGTAPTWDATGGWTFNGSTQYLTTGIIPAANWTMIVRYSNYAGVGQGLFGSRAGFGSSEFDVLLISPNIRWSYGNSNNTTIPYAASGIIALAGADGYLDGALKITVGGSGLLPAPVAIYIGDCNNNGANLNRIGAKIQAVWIASSKLDAAANLAMYTAMAAL